MKILLFIVLCLFLIVGCTNQNKSVYPDDGKATPILSVRIASMPPHGNYQSVLVLNGMSPDSYSVSVYTLDQQEQMRDSLLLYSREKVRDGAEIRQRFEITKEYQFKVSKHLNDVLIEQLYYVIDENGIFQEQRDGYTPAVAYESWDGIHYQVDSFIWDHNQTGGLYMKDKKTVIYTLEPDGSVIP